MNININIDLHETNWTWVQVCCFLHRLFPSVMLYGVKDVKKNKKKILNKNLPAK